MRQIDVVARLQQGPGPILEAHADGASLSCATRSNSARCSSCVRIFSRSTSICLSCSDTARPSTGLVRRTPDRSSACSSKKCGIFRQVARDIVGIQTVHRAHRLLVWRLKRWSLKGNFAFEYRDRRPGHAHRAARAVPGDRQLAAARGDRHRRTTAARAGYRPPRRRRRRCRRPGFRRRRAHTRAGVIAWRSTHLHEAGIDPLRKARVTFDQRAVGGDRRGFDLGHDLHRMRIAHRHHADVDSWPPTIAAAYSWRRLMFAAGRLHRTGLRCGAAAARPCRP